MTEALSISRRAIVFIFALLFTLQYFAHQTIILISLDGMRWDYPLTLTSFKRLSSEGTRAERMQPVFPSLTFVNHASMATGATAEEHGIVSNHFLNDGTFIPTPAKASLLQRKPLWVLTEESGLKSAVLEWPVSEGPYNSIQPSYYETFNESREDSERVKNIISLLNKDEKKRPFLIMAWFHGADNIGHDYGPESPEMKKRLLKIDSYLNKLLTEIGRLPDKSEITLIIVSDHGMAAVSRAIDSTSLLPKRGFFPFISPAGAVCNIYLGKKQSPGDAIRELKTKSEGFDVFRKQDLLKYGYSKNDRIGDIVLVAKRGYYFGSFSRHNDMKQAKGMHGYDPSWQEMGGIFYARGIGFKAGEVKKEVSVLDIAPTILSCLNLKTPSEMKGKSLLSQEIHLPRKKAG